MVMQIYMIMDMKGTNTQRGLPLRVLLRQTLQHTVIPAFAGMTGL
jgi:hypothetical protein